MSRRFVNLKEIVQFDSSILTYATPSDAHIAFNVSSKEAACPDSGWYSISGISSQANGLCQEGGAWKATYKSKYVYYIGIVRCGRVFLSFEVETNMGSDFDDSFNLVEGMEIAIPKVKELP